jgi:hypothetical protein
VDVGQHVARHAGAVASAAAAALAKPASRQAQAAATAAMPAVPRASREPVCLAISASTSIALAQSSRHRLARDSVTGPLSTKSLRG